MRIHKLRKNASLKAVAEAAKGEADWLWDNYVKPNQDHWNSGKPG